MQQIASVSIRMHAPKIAGKKGHLRTQLNWSKNEFDGYAWRLKKK
jgi:hypothetical protein